MPALNELIWISVRPILKLAIPAAAGFALTRADLFPVAGSRSVSQIILNVTLPALLFSKIIPSFTSENVSAIGPIILTGIFYMGLSFIFGAIIRAVFPTPRNFRYGILAAATWSNWGDLPTSVVQTITLSAPFSGQQDSDLAVAYVAIFILLFYVTLFPAGGTFFISGDYTNPPKEEDEESAEDLARGKWWRVKAVGARVRSLPTLVRRRKGRKGEGEGGDEVDGEGHEMGKTVSRGRGRTPGHHGSDEPPFPTTLRRASTSKSHDLRRVVTTASVRELAGAAAAAAFEDTTEHNRRVSHGRTHRTDSDRARMQTIQGSRANSAFGDDEITFQDGSALDDSPSPTPTDKRPSSPPLDPTSPPPLSRGRRVFLGVKSFVFSLITPPTIALVSALVCALVIPLKALFVLIPEGNFHPTAPDGGPPLGIILDTATFVGNASVPLGLLVLGSALARMRLPRPFSKLPIASIVALAVAKLVILPIVGFFFVQTLVRHGIVARENTVLRFVLVFFSCVPTATTQVALTQIFAPEDGENNSDVLAAYLIAQYCIFAISSVILTAFTLSAF